MSERSETRASGPKLVRDRIPQIICAAGEEPEIRVAEDGELAALLSEKLREEIGEFLEAMDPEELADVLEVVYALADHLGIGRDGLESRRAAKAAERGGFAARIVWAGNAPQR